MRHEVTAALARLISTASGAGIDASCWVVAPGSKTYGRATVPGLVVDCRLCTGTCLGPLDVLEPRCLVVDRAWPGIGDVPRGVERDTGGRVSFGGTKMS